MPQLTVNCGIVPYNSDTGCRYKDELSSQNIGTIITDFVKNLHQIVQFSTWRSPFKEGLKAFGGTQIHYCVLCKVVPHSFGTLNKFVDDILDSSAKKM
jgi:hypothetical protein